MSPLLLFLLAVTTETVWCQDQVFSREQLSQALSKLTERVTELEEKKKQAGEVAKVVEQLGDKMTEGIGELGEQLGDKLTEGIGKLGDNMAEVIEKLGETLGDKMTEGIQKLGEKIGERDDARANKLSEYLEKVNAGLDNIGSGVERIGETLVGKENICPAISDQNPATVAPTQTPSTATPTQLSSTVVPGKKSASCDEVKEYDRSNGVHTLTVNGEDIKVFCDQQTAGGGWTVLQRRQDGSVDFNRNWTDYENGFGDLNGEFWLGLSNIYRLTSSNNYSLRVDLTDWDNITAYALYDTFYIDGPDQNYTLHVAGYSGTAGDSLISSATGKDHLIHDNQPFSTPDRDHDQSDNNCAAINHSGWWHNSCFQAQLNGPYGQSRSCDLAGCIMWYAWHNDLRSYKHVSMMIKQRN